MNDSIQTYMDKEIRTFVIFAKAFFIVANLGFSMFRGTQAEGLLKDLAEINGGFEPGAIGYF